MEDADFERLAARLAGVVLPRDDSLRGMFESGELSYFVLFALQDAAEDRVSLPGDLLAGIEAAVPRVGYEPFELDRIADAMTRLRALTAV